MSKLREAGGGAVFLERPKRLGSTVYDLLLERLMSLEIEPGERIAVDNLVREVGVSQTPIREALSRLEAQGLVVKTHLVGYRAAPHFSVMEFEHLYEVRRLLEPKAAAHASRDITDEALVRLRAHLVLMEQLRNDGSREAYNVFARRDVEFHALVAGGCANRFLREAINTWSLQFHLFRRGHQPEWLQAVLTEHLDILSCISERRDDAAAASMALHIENSYARFKQIMAPETTMAVQGARQTASQKPNKRSGDGTPGQPT